MSAQPVGFRYRDDEVAAIRATLHTRPFHRWPDVQNLESLAFTYLFRISRARTAASKKQITEEEAERDRTVERVRRAVPVSDRAERVMSIIDGITDKPGSPLPTWLLAQAMLEGEITCAELEALIVKEYLSSPGRLDWRGRERWLFADDRKKAHRFEYIKQLVCYWAEDQGCRPDEVSVSAVESARGDRLMDFILAAAARPLREAGEEIGADRLLDIVQEVKEYWRGRPWEDDEAEAVLAAEAELDKRRAGENME